MGENSGDDFSEQSMFCKLMCKFKKAFLKNVFPTRIPSKSANHSHRPPMYVYGLAAKRVKRDAKLTGFTVRGEHNFVSRKMASDI